MNGISRSLALGLPLGLLVLAGCSNADGPATPAQGSASPNALPTTRAARDSNTGLVAEFRATLDPALGTIAIEPVTRAGSAIGDTFSEVGLTPAFTGQFGTHFWAEAVRRNGSTVEVDFATRHPFTAEKRPDLAIFNMKLWVAPEITETTVAGISGVPGFVTNSDGHGDMWSLTATDTPAPGLATFQPYVIIHEDPTSAPFDFQAPAGWNVLFPGQSSVDTVEIDLSTVPAGPVTLHLYLTADYGQSAVRATRQSPAYELPKFAGNAPWKVEMRTLTTNLEEGNTASSADYRLDIWDWKHGQTLGSDVSSAQVFAPMLQALPITPTLSGTGTDPTPLTATVTLVNTLNAAGGDYWGVVAVYDAATGTALKDDLVTPISATYATYQWFPIVVDAVPDVPPTAAITRCIGGDIVVGTEETFDGSTSTAGTNPITTYEWDFSYDGLFNVEATGITADHTFNTPEVVTMAMRASDGFGNSDVESITFAVNATPTWTALTRLTNNSIWERFEDQSEVSPGLVTEPDGTVHLIWFDVGPPFKVVHTQLDQCSTTWGAEETIFTQANQAFGNVTAAVTSDGVVHTTFRPPLNSQYVYVNNAGGTWSSPVDITTTPLTGTGGWRFGIIATTGDDKVGFMGSYERNQNPAAVNGNGIPAVPRELFFSERNAGTWGAIAQIGTGDHVSSFPNPGGYSGIVPSQTFTGTATGDWLGVWQTLKTPHTGGAAVSNTSNLRWARSNSGVWTPQATLYSALSDHDRCVVFRAPNGNIWLTTSSNSNVAVANYNGAVWSPALTTVFTSIFSSAYSYIGFDDSGSAVICASGSTAIPTGSAVVARRFNQTDTPAAVAATAIMTPSAAVPNIHQRFPSVVSRMDGRFALVVSTSRYGAIFNGLEFEYTYLQ